MPTRYKGTEEEVRALDTYIKLMRAADTLTRSAGKCLDRAGLTVSQLGVLEALLHVGPMCQKDLSEKILKSTGNITMVVDNLERHGLVRRERGTTDRRYVTVHLTDAGRTRIEEVFPEHAREITGAMVALTPAEQAELGRLCRKLGRGGDEPS
jgi:MarR family 2-MHQ and catechol resistance regulon transcriptional repressor